MKFAKIKKFVTNLHDNNEYVFLLRNLEETLNYGLILKTIYRVV